MGDFTSYNREKANSAIALYDDNPIEQQMTKDQ